MISHARAAMQKTPWKYIASCISNCQTSDQLFARLESSAGLVDGSQPNLRCGYSTALVNSLVSPCLARPANAPQPEAKSLTQNQGQTKDVKGCQSGLGMVGDHWGWFGSYVSVLVVVISVDPMLNVCSLFSWFAYVCVCDREKLMLAYHVYKLFMKVLMLVTHVSSFLVHPTNVRSLWFV